MEAVLAGGSQHCQGHHRIPVTQRLDVLLGRTHSAQLDLGASLRDLLVALGGSPEGREPAACRAVPRLLLAKALSLTVSSTASGHVQEDEVCSKSNRRTVMPGSSAVSVSSHWAGMEAVEQNDQTNWAQSCASQLQGALFRESKASGASQIRSVLRKTGVSDSVADHSGTQSQTVVSFAERTSYSSERMSLDSDAESLRRPRMTVMSMGEVRQSTSSFYSNLASKEANEQFGALSAWTASSQKDLQHIQDDIGCVAASNAEQQSPAEDDMPMGHVLTTSQQRLLNLGAYQTKAQYAAMLKMAEHFVPLSGRHSEIQNQCAKQEGDIAQTCEHLRPEGPKSQLSNKDMQQRNSKCCGLVGSIADCFEGDLDVLGVPDMSAARASAAMFSMTSKAVSCMERLPERGDVVYVANLHEYVAVVYGDVDAINDCGDDCWLLPPGQEAVVVDVDSDGDFKLRNRRGEVSDWTYRSRFVFKECPPREASPSSSTSHDFDETNG